MILKREAAALVFIDVQGKLHELMYGKEQLDANLEKVIRGARLLELPILATEQLPEKLGPTSEPFRTLMADVPMIPKSAFSCCGEPRFVEALREAGKKQLILAGMETHVCVYQTALDLLAAGHEVIVAADAVSSRTSENKALALQALRETGIHILPVETILFALLRDAADPRFRELLKLVK
jgi:nicotinamidase-related amidase